MGRLENKVAVITGAASGMGRGTAIRFAGEGAAVVIADLNEEGGEAAVRECRENGGHAVFQKTDVANETDVRAAVALAVKEFGKLDIIYNNAGLVGAVGPIEGTPVEDWDRTFSVLTRGVFLGMKHATPEMRKNGGGSIVSTASIAGLFGGYGTHAYSAAKAAVVNLTRSVALEVAKYKIRVNCICPGGINTPIFNVLTKDANQMEKLLATLSPLKRSGHSEDIANMALFLASDEAQFVTGQALVVDGGVTAGPQPIENSELGSALSNINVYVGPSFTVGKS
jgi:NAD(P)-dependent dehydrogenase (short-subunit alcohol dehydrogenase family)